MSPPAVDTVSGFRPPAPLAARPSGTTPADPSSSFSRKPAPSASARGGSPPDPFAGPAGPSAAGPSAAGHSSASTADECYLSGHGSRHGSFASQTGGGADDADESKNGAPPFGGYGMHAGLGSAGPSSGGDLTLFGGEEVFGGGSEADAGAYAAGRTPSVEELLADSMHSFHRDGALVNPMEAQRARNWRAAPGTSGASDPSAAGTTREKMQFIADAKGFDYGIFWRLDPREDVFRYDDAVALSDGETLRGAGFGFSASREEDNQGTGGVGLYVRTAVSMFSSWIMGFGMVGRVGYTGNYEWHEEVTALPAWCFQRLRQAKNAGIKTIVGVPIRGGVVELGATRMLPHNVGTVQYVQKVMGGPAPAKGGGG